ncbi:nuclease PIN [Rufibacter sp. DG15C]|uniref:pirin family protein n=1 Tax=Rufibacter sp. DG15C TaxID=1379909 RepID=UPI00078C5761|nr:pirin family protein [Rufibacter sp. DG15C]AMM51473.1 nuclease PIN [Rufibacter sp. DG15C]
MRTIKKIHKAEYSPIADLITYSPLPSRGLQMIDPFLFLNHHGHQVYKPNNNGLPFGPHPHRGMETMTFILEGDIMHKDSGGHESVITAGGAQYMTAGRGLIHAEVSSLDFKAKGGPLEILQLWMNLPARHKMMEPAYKGLQKEDIPSFSPEDDKVTINLVSGTWGEHKGAFDTVTDILLGTIYFQPGGELKVSVPAERNIFFYIIKGSLTVNGQEVPYRNLVEFNNDGEELEVKASEESILLFGHAAPFNEPVVAQGPFVMNSEAEIRQAYQDYQQGKFGQWKH